MHQYNFSPKLEKSTSIWFVLGHCTTTWPSLGITWEPLGRERITGFWILKIISAKICITLKILFSSIKAWLLQSLFLVSLIGIRFIWIFLAFYCQDLVWFPVIPLPGAFMPCDLVIQCNFLTENLFVFLTLLWFFKAFLKYASTTYAVLFTIYE